MSDKNESAPNANEGADPKLMMKARKIAARGQAKTWKDVVDAMEEADAKRFRLAATARDRDDLDRLCTEASSLVRQHSK